MISIKELASDKTEYSSTRWAFCITVIFDMIIIVLSIVSYIVLSILGKSVDNNLFSGISVLLGILTTLTATPKMLQGFEPYKDKKKEDEDKIEPTPTVTPPKEEHFATPSVTPIL